MEIYKKQTGINKEKCPLYISADGVTVTAAGGEADFMGLKVQTDDNFKSLQVSVFE